MKVIIIGGGFAGLKLSRSLNNKAGIEVTLIDQFNYHQFQPLFYQVATSGLDASNISFPLRKVFHDSRNVRIRIGQVKEVLPAQNKIIIDTGFDTAELTYDILVMATGANTNFFGNPQLEQYAFPMKSTIEALRLRNTLLQNFENAVIENDPLVFERLMNIVIVGGGPTGVEVAGAIADLRRFVLPKDYPELDFQQMKIYLLEGAPKLLGVMSEKSSRQSKEYLERLGVIVLTEAIVKDYDGQQVTLSNGNTINTATVIWAAGIKGNLLPGIDAANVVRGNRVKVDRYNKILGSANIYALGDVASMETALYPNGHPQVASVAIQQAAQLAKNLVSIAHNTNKLKEFEYKDKGSMATVGRNLAVVDLPQPKMHFKGFFAWLIWMSLHLMLILGVKNRLFVFLNWLYNYVTYDQSLRLIFNVERRKKTQ